MYWRRRQHSGQHAINVSVKFAVMVFIAVTGVFCYPPYDSFAVDLGVVGKTYPIAERDAREDMRDRINAINWKDVLAKAGVQKKAKNLRPAGLTLLPRALEDRTRMVDVNYTLGFDIPDGKGNVLYPKGYTFNPLDYMTYTRTIVIMNGDDRRQVDWFKASSYHKKPNVMILITDGNYYDLSMEFGQPVFFVDNRIIERFSLRAVPSVINQRKKMMEVREFEIHDQSPINADN